ncbi:MAG: hypothetical protein PHW02_04330 [bacterium]|nr:hypothetical protein [bacterium]
MMPERIRRQMYGQYVNQFNRVSVGESIERMNVVIVEQLESDPMKPEERLVVKRDTAGNYITDEQDKPIYETDEANNPKIAKGGAIVLPSKVAGMKINRKKMNQKMLIEIINKVIQDDYSVSKHHPLVWRTPITGYALRKGLEYQWFDLTTDDEFNNLSYAVEVKGIDSIVLSAFADSLRVAFEQQSVLMVDRNQNNAPFFVNVPPKIVWKKPPLREKISWKIYEIIDKLLNLPYNDEYYIEKNRKYREEHKNNDDK